MFTGEVLQKGIFKFALLRPPLDAGLLPDDLHAKAHLLDLAPETGVACTVEFGIALSWQETWSSAFGR